MKAGHVALIGRPNSGKSTLLNAILGHKVSITSPKPQTTRYSIEAIFEDERGQIIFIDTPGIFAKVHDPVSQRINRSAEKSLKQRVDIIVYIIDHSRAREDEENKIIGILRKIEVPKILAINKIDIKEPTFLPHYAFLEKEYDKTIHVSGLFHSNLNYLLDAIFDLLPEGEKFMETKDLPTPLLSMDSKTFVAEIIREKAYLFLRKEVPYTLTAVVEEITKRVGNATYIRAKILTTADRYKIMIIGEKGRMIKEIGMAVRKELETATNQKIFLELTVEVNPHWFEAL